MCTGVNAGFYCGEPLGGTCTQDSECQVYKFCDAGTCMSRAQLGAACAPSGHYADGGNGGLPGCDTGDDCCAGEGCYPSGAQPFWCMRNPGMACLADDDCGSRVCDAGTCQ